MIHCADFSVIDDMLQVTDKDAFLAARELALREGILAGGSSGAALWGVRQLAKKLNRPARIVTIFPDGASRYLSTIYNDEWLKDKGMNLVISDNSVCLSRVSAARKRELFCLFFVYYP